MTESTGASRAQTGPGATAQRPPCLPSTSLEPRVLAACAAALLVIDDARLHGLIDDGPIIDRGRCREILTELQSQGVVPDPDEAAVKVLELMAELGEVRG